MPNSKNLQSNTSVHFRPTRKWIVIVYRHGVKGKCALDTIPQTVKGIPLVGSGSCIGKDLCTPKGCCSPMMNAVVTG